jgi:two-component system, sensor histidine kinase LadS
MKLFLLILLFVTNLFSNDVFIVDKKIQEFNASSYIFYIQDKNNSLNAEEILKSNTLQQLKNNGQLPNISGPFWSRFEIKNDTSELRHLLIYNILAGTNYIDVFLYKNNILEKQYLLGDMREQSTREILSRYSAFELTLKPDESYTIISKVDNYNIVNLSWIVSDYNYYISNESKKLLFFGLFGGVFILFSILSFILYFIYKEKSYMTVGVYTLLIILYLYSVQGINYNLDIGMNLEFSTISAWTVPSMTSMLLLLFTKQFFSIKEKYIKFYYVMLTLFIVHGFVFSITLYGLLVNPYFLKYSFLIGISVVATNIYLVVAGLYMKEVGSKYYLLGQIISIFAVILITISIFGIIPYFEIYRNLTLISNFIDIILLLIAQTIKTKYKINLLNSRKLALVEHSRFSAMGYAINNITHQWKHPLTHLGSSIALIEAIAKNKKESIIEYLNQELPKISYSINLMKNTLDEFSNYYTKDMKKENFSPKDSISHIIHILNSKIVLKNTTICLNIEEDLKIYNYEHVFSNIMIILIDNSLDAFETTSKNNQITISITSDTDTIYLILEDNAGGIKIKPIEKVFELNISTKDNEKNKGIGLSLVKMLVEERFDGNINVSNTDDGAIFKIKIKKTNTKES